MDITREQFSRHSEQEFTAKFGMYVDSGAGVIHVRTNEVIRAAQAVRKAAIIEGNVYQEWDIVNGFRRFTEDNIYDNSVVGDDNVDISSAFASPLGALRDGARVDTRYFCYINPHVFMESNPHMQQMLQHYLTLLPPSKVCVVLITPDIPLAGVSNNTLSLFFNPPGISELRECLEFIVDGVKNDFTKGISLTEADKDRICYVGSGMTKAHFEMYTALAIVEAGRNGKTQLTVEDLLEGVTVGKTDVVNSSDILELYPSGDIANVGGMENLKEWVRKRSQCYSDEARDFGIEPPKGLVLVGPPGCAYGGTEITYRRGIRNSGRTLTLEELYYKFNNLPCTNNGTGNNTPWHDRTLPTYIQSLGPDGDVFYNRVISVIPSGKKPVIKVTVNTGESIQLTSNHPVALPGGRFVPIGELRVGTTVLMKGSMLPTSTGGRKVDARPPRRSVAVSYHPNTKRQARYSRLVIEAHMNSMPVEEFIHILKHNEPLSCSLKYLPPEYDVHHMDEDTTNDELSNLMVIDAVEHSRLHGKRENFNVEYVREATVVEVEELSACMTYDVQMDMPANNFVANDFIVHNTGKSLAAKAIGSVLGIPVVRLDFGRVFNSFVGASEQRIRTSLKQVEAMSPCVLFADEIDKGLGGIANGASGDSGTSMRVLGSFLTWLQDCKHPVFTMVTANNINGLPPELLRRGRFDAIFSVMLPNARERREVLAIHLRLRHRDIAEFEDSDVQKVIDASARYVSAEIESAVKDALVNAFSNGEELTMGHVQKALLDMVPLSKSFEEQISAMELWSKNNATPASLSEEWVAQRELEGRNRIRISKRSRK